MDGTLWMLLGSWLAQGVICMDLRNGTEVLVWGKTTTGRFDNNVATDILIRPMQGMAVGQKKCGTNSAVMVGRKKQQAENGW